MTLKPLRDNKHQANFVCAMDFENKMGFWYIFCSLWKKKLDSQNTETTRSYHTVHQDSTITLDYFTKLDHWINHART